MNPVRTLRPLVAVMLVGCSMQPDTTTPESAETKPQSSATATAESAQPTADSFTEWIGVYSSPSEIGAFTGTVLELRDGLGLGLMYSKKFYTDVRSADEIPQDERSGSVLIEGNCVYIPEAYGYYHDGKPSLQASVDRYTRVEVNGHVVLMRDDAYEAFTTADELYDYGILIKVADERDLLLDLEDVEHKSIKVLYRDDTKPWQDPFVHGSNER